MAEAILTRSTDVSSSEGLNKSEVIKVVDEYMSPGNQLFTSNGTFIVPKTGYYEVICVGGGGGGGGGCINIAGGSSHDSDSGWDSASLYANTISGGGGGGSGYNNYSNLLLNAGEIINVNIGRYGVHGNSGSVVANNLRVYGSATEYYCNGYFRTANATDGTTGGTTFFGNYLSAIGGNGGKGAIWGDVGIGGDGGKRGSNGNSFRSNYYYGSTFINNNNMIGGAGGYGYLSASNTISSSGTYGCGGNGGNANISINVKVTINGNMNQKIYPVYQSTSNGINGKSGFIYISWT